ncbi:MAG: 1-acyl-sn-glycerol-3-phosphate acyltransferase [Gammaproteobacteria bacterium]|nr:1-acyl-sn-glycerol-3-phosphate acyltransferase [Gammaproteobacteria bacterium]
MILLRSLVYFVLMSLTILVYGLAAAVFGSFLPGSSVDRITTQWGRVNLWLQHWICGLRYRIEGEQNLPRLGPAVVMSKHQSAWETIALRGILRPDQSWVLKQELMRIPFFGWGLKFVKSIPIDRSAGRRSVVKVVEYGKRYLGEGRLVIIFPEGTRTAPGTRKKYGVGGGVLAERSGVDVIPIAHNAGVFWRRRGVKKYPGEIQVIVGAPISTQGKKAVEIMREVEDWIESQQEKLPLERA